jgi:hypothetical protein
MIADLTGLADGNASLLDEATAAAEAMTLMRRADRKATGAFVVDADVFPQTLAVVRTRAGGSGSRSSSPTSPTEGLPEGDLFGVSCNIPGQRPHQRPRPVIEAMHERTAWRVVAADLLALTLLDPAGGVGCRRRRRHGAAFRRADGLRRPARRLHGRAGRPGAQLPGRLVGVSVDADGRRPTGWPCRPASSTSAARRRRRTSAPRRSCSRSMAAHVRQSTTAPTAARDRLGDDHGARRPTRRRCAPVASRSCTRPSSTPAGGVPAARERSSRALDAAA